MRWGITNNPDVVATNPAAVGAIVTMGGSMWRSLYVRHTRRCDAIRYSSPMGPPMPPGVPVEPFPSPLDTTAFDRHPAAVAAGAAAPPPQRRVVALRWDGAHKTNRHAGNENLPSTARFGFLAAPWVLDIIDNFVPAAHDPSDTALLFPGRDGAPLSFPYLTRVLRALLRGLPGSTDATLHGLRLGIDAELRALGVADELRDALGWWRRLVRRMASHYEALDAARLAAAAALYGTLLAATLAPGLMATSALFRGSPMTAAPWFVRGAAPRANAHPAAGGGGGGAGAARGEAGGMVGADRRIIRCGGCGQEGHNARNQLCPVFAAPVARLDYMQPSDAHNDGSESDSDDDETNRLTMARPPMAPTGLPRAIVDGSVGSSLLRVTTAAAARRALAAAGAGAGGAGSSGGGGLGL